MVLTDTNSLAGIRLYGPMAMYEAALFGHDLLLWGHSASCGHQRAPTIAEARPFLHPENQLSSAQTRLDCPTLRIGATALHDSAKHQRFSAYLLHLGEIVRG